MQLTMLPYIVEMLLWPAILNAGTGSVKRSKLARLLFNVKRLQLPNFYIFK